MAQNKNKGKGKGKGKGKEKKKCMYMPNIVGFKFLVFVTLSNVIRILSCSTMSFQRKKDKKQQLLSC